MSFGTLRLLCVVVVVTLASSAGSAQVDPAGDQIARARALIDATATGDPVAALQAVLSAQGYAVRPADLGRASAPEGIPAELAEPVTRLLAATQTAEQLRRTAFAGLTAAERLTLRGNVLVAPARRSDAAVLRAGRVAELTSEPWQLSDAARDAGARVDRSALARAALTLVAAIAQHDLPAVAGEAPSTCGATGDMIFETTDCSLMIGGTGPNGYGPGVDPQLLVDLGGDDVYTNGAGAGIGAVRVVVDVAGNDTYSAVQAFTDVMGTATINAQGVGNIGVGVLADLGGDDTYETIVTATAPQPGPVARAVGVFAQGAGVLGAGVLLDTAGDDVYTASASSSGAGAAASAQGVGQAGIGALLDLGAPEGNDTSTVEATSTLHETERTPLFARFGIGAAQVSGQGAGVIGAGTFLDAGGSDAYVAEARGGTATALVQGASTIGAGALIDVAGDDAMTALAEGDTTLSLITTDPKFCWDAATVVNIGSTRVLAQGATDGAGAGLLADGGGNDTREATAHGRAEAITAATSSFDCTSFGGNSASAEARIGPGTVNAQGDAVLGVAALVDLDGDDANHMEASSEAHATATATSPGPDTESATATAAPATIEGQGSSDTGLAVIADAAGDDAYTTMAFGSERETTGGGDVTRPVATVQHIQGWGVGEAGAGWLVDLGGADTYTSSPPASAAANDSCWSNEARGRGRDLTLPALPGGCP